METKQIKTARKVYILRSNYGIEAVYGSKKVARQEAVKLAEAGNEVKLSDYDDNRWESEETGEFYAVEAFGIF